MINKPNFNNIRLQLKQEYEQRDVINKLSREITSLSKIIIYSIQRNDLNLVTQLKQINLKASKLRQFQKFKDLSSYQIAMQEYVEALAFYDIVKNKRLPSPLSLKVDTEEYLLGLCDLTGELTRKAINSIIYHKEKDAIEIKNFVDSLYGELLKFNIRNSELRKKFDSIKYNLKKLEEIILDLTLKRR
jgi:predicted translin family RNA/ssDNA-binding protein